VHPYPQNSLRKKVDDGWIKKFNNLRKRDRVAGNPDGDAIGLLTRKTKYP
jgi:hypothetical protein